MTGLLIEKELRLTLLTFRFAACSLLLVVLIVASTGVLVPDWHREVDRFRAGVERAEQAARAATAYVQVKLEVGRQPRLLGLINHGVGDRFGRTVTLSGKYDAPRLSGGIAESFSSRDFLPVDFAHLVGIVLSLVALVFSHDLVNGDRAQGTLQMVLAFGAPRAKLLLGKYLGALLGVLAPFGAAVAVWLLILQTTTGAETTVDFWARFAVVLLLSVLYASIFLWLGLLVSTLTRRPATALILALLAWTVLVVIYPPAAMQVVRLVHPLTEIVVEEDDPAKLVGDERLRARVEAARWEVVDRALAQYRTARALLRLSPLASYDFATAALAGTDVDRHVALLQGARQVDQALRGWQAEKARAYPEREFAQMNVPKPLDLSGLPAAREQAEEVDAALVRSLPDVALLVIFNLAVMVAAQVAFQRYDARL
jgi:ABC-type transport system involved in multi-copper enzyme maturation permease subunit